ncbi:hypothetical protein F5887DRAFT_85666 [Amanita rubescens]|nr:hypothetical protein F5887DRAFT_85666 [Amanita rubescens]
MNLQKLTKLFAVRRVGSSVTEGERNDFPSSPCTGASDIWIDNFIRALNVASALGGSFPPLKAATETLNVILKDFQGVRNNTADLRGLVAAITKLLKLLNDQIRSYGEAVSKDAKFIQLFNEFNSCLLTMKEDIDEVLNKSYKSLGKRTLHKDALSRLNTDCMKRMDDLRLNFLVQLGLDTRRIIASGYNEAYGAFEDIDTSDYYKYKTADIHLIESLLSEDRDQLTEESFVKVDGKPDIYTFRRYCGNDAFTMFRKDLEAFSHYKHPNIRQMFGICESKLSPGILFRGKLVRLRDYSARDALNSLMSWIYFVDGYKVGA